MIAEKLILRKVILLLLSIIVSGNAVAEWVAISTGDNETTSVYVDPSTKNKSGNRVKIWSMVDFRKAVKLSDGKQFLSWKTQYEFDCKIRQSRILAASMHSGNMGNGEVTNSLDFDTQKWEAVPLGSNGEVLWNDACETQFKSEQAAQKHCPGDVVVWLNPASGVIHYKGQQWYGRTKTGVYVCKSEAAR
jgi:hypothetical protein